MNTPVLDQSLKLSNLGSSQYLDGWPHGKTEVTKYFFVESMHVHSLEAIFSRPLHVSRSLHAEMHVEVIKPFLKKKILSSNNGQKEHAFHLFISILTLIIFLNIFLWNLFYLFLFETNYKRHLNTIFFIFLL